MSQQHRDMNAFRMKKATVKGLVSQTKSPFYPNDISQGFHVYLKILGVV